MNLLGLSELNPERQTSVLQRHRQEICENWLSAMRQKWIGKPERKLYFLESKIADHRYLLSLRIACSVKTEAYYRHSTSLINPPGPIDDHGHKGCLVGIFGKAVTTTSFQRLRESKNVGINALLGGLLLSIGG